MNAIDKLYHISQKKTKLIIGLMSGTSLDGLDIALCQISGYGLQSHLQIIAFETVAYNDFIRDNIKEIFAQTKINLQKLTLLHQFLGKLYADIILETLKKWHISPQEIDCIASHGQTIFHAPKRLHKIDFFGNATLQIADAEQIAYHTGIITLSDFRQKHIAAGGEGAPLVVYGDYLLFSSKQENRILLNIGGIANLTYLPSSLQANEVFATDVGAGNTLIDYFAKKYYHIPFDAEGKIAESGLLNEFLLDKLLEIDFFSQDFPKTTGQETFSPILVENIISELAPQIAAEDLLCTLTHFTAKGILRAIEQLNIIKSSIYVSGGGAFNTFLIKLLSQELSVQLFDVLGFDPQAKEAALFAILANETLSGSKVSLGKGKFTNPAVCMGKISLPN
ncbi:MAG: anhydro-N-acetylmuramic acid kinase [Thermonemataceae bacterium]|nr:anhydro-N-acetylmuramic acid kinase [Thermonemataceae bacterium]